jgi:hypothetical protein
MTDAAEGNGGSHGDLAVAMTRLFNEALNARDFQAARVLVSDDVVFRGPNGSSLRGPAAASEVLEAAAHVDLIVVRTALEELADDDGATRVTVPVREIIGKVDLFRTLVFEVRDGAITSYETLTNE